jgi:hypothetical protein
MRDGCIIMNCEDRRRKMSSVTQGAVPEMTYLGRRGCVFRIVRQDNQPMSWI